MAVQGWVGRFYVKTIVWLYLFPGFSSSGIAETEIRLTSSLLYSAQEEESTRLTLTPRVGEINSGAVTLQAHLATTATVFVCTLIAAVLR